MTPISPNYQLMLSLADAIGSGQFFEEDGLISCTSEVPDGYFTQKQRETLLRVGWHFDGHDNTFWLEGFSA